MQIATEYKDLVSRVCFLYSGPGAAVEDLYQEVMANLWEGFESFRGDAKMSTWIYRAALNTCISWHRRNDRYQQGAMGLEQMVTEPPDNSDAAYQLESLRALHSLISRLNPLEKALITLWLDEKPYDEIAEITGISKSNVAVKIHRIKDKLSKMAEA